MYTPNFAKPTVLSVTQLTTYIKTLIENDPRLNIVFLTGEISNLRSFRQGQHCYFTLKDSGAVISAAMFAGNTRNLKFQPQEGMKVICRGRVELYAPHGKYQIIVEDMQPDGIGALNLAFEQLKKELFEKGLFSQEHKKPIPRFPKTVGVITSPTGAAVQDIKNILYRRFPCVDVIMCPVLVQGDSAAPQLVNAVNTLSENSLCDVIIIGRGGGSIEDLWAFNDKELAYAIYNCGIPVISAVGHETDFTICDFVSDMRAPTPSAAAELAVPDRADLINDYNSKLRFINSSVKGVFGAFRSQNEAHKKRIEANSPQNKIIQMKSGLALLEARFSNSLNSKILKNEGALKAAASKLEGLNPVAVLARGYSIAEKDGMVITKSEQLHSGDKFTLTFSDGKTTAVVTEK